MAMFFLVSLLSPFFKRYLSRKIVSKVLRQKKYIPISLTFFISYMFKNGEINETKNISYIFYFTIKLNLNKHFNKTDNFPS
ncbi:hypothetical protein K502DRAFT_247395 [Neoconidiobolus thromboides FSU 785]|nr:hypothetical protein K502DRAFT_247395 [Neoconidiobolus thromboides FSU 785]